MESLACGCLTFVGPFYKNNREAMEFSCEKIQPAAVQVVSSSQEFTQSILQFATQWTASHREELRGRVLQKTGVSVKIAAKVTIFE
jgi:hypothetical protein